MGSAYDHNLAYTNYNQVCVYCHTPHDSNQDNSGRLLWNRTFPTVSYTLYESPTSKLKPSQPTAGTSSSILCLSCHDGTIAVDSVINPPNQPFKESTNHRRMSGDISSDTCGGCHNGAGGAPDTVRHAFLGTDLGNDHPINVAYNPSINTGLNSEGSVTAAGLKLYSGKVECATCHDPHTTANKAFLRMANSGSSMCLTCHNK